MGFDIGYGKGNGKGDGYSLLKARALLYRLCTVPVVAIHNCIILRV